MPFDGERSVREHQGRQQRQRQRTQSALDNKLRGVIDA